jgi:hypothetical protein
MERAGQPRHRLHNPRGEGERAGCDRINPSIGGLVNGERSFDYLLFVNGERDNETTGRIIMKQFFALFLTILTGVSSVCANLGDSDDPPTREATARQAK